MECRMKKIVIGILVLSFSVNLHANENNLSGFGKIKWEESIKKYKSVMRLTSEIEKPRKFYVKENDEMFFGEVKLASISYIFYKDKFSSVVIHTERSAGNSKKILNIIKNKFGNPTYANKYTNKYRWENEFTNIALKCFASSHTCSIIYNSAVMSKLEKADNDVMVRK